MFNLFCLGIFTLCSLYAQSISVYMRPGKNKFTLFEKEMIQTFFNFHNLKTDDTLSFKIIPLVFKDIFPILDKANSESTVLAVQAVSMTNDRINKYDFSEPYMINRPVILKSKKNKKNISLTSKEAVFVTTKGAIYEPLLIDLNKKTNQKFQIYISLQQLVDDLDNGIVDYWYTDYIFIWTYDLEEVKEINMGSLDKYGLIFPKNSTLNKKINPTFKEFLKSQQFYSIVKKHLGKDALNYFQKGLKRSF